MTSKNFALYASLFFSDLTFATLAMPILVAADIMFFKNISFQQIFTCTKLLIFTKVPSNFNYSSVIAVLISYRLWNIATRNHTRKSLRNAIAPTMFSLIYSVTIATISILCYARAWVTIFNVIVECFLLSGVIVLLSVSVIILKKFQMCEGEDGVLRSSS